MVVPMCIDEILSKVQYGNDIRKVLAAWKRLKQDLGVFDT
jgi:hypothetical protein